MKVYLCRGAFLCSIPLPSGFDWRIGSEVSMGHIFPLGVLAPVTLVGGADGDEGLKSEPEVNLGFSYAQWLIPSYHG